MKILNVPERGDYIYYNGIIFGHFGSVVKVNDDGTILARTEHLNILTSEHVWASDRWNIPRANGAGTVVSDRAEDAQTARYG